MNSQAAATMRESTKLAANALDEEKKTGTISISSKSNSITTGAASKKGDSAKGPAVTKKKKQKAGDRESS